MLDLRNFTMRISAILVLGLVAISLASGEVPLPLSDCEMLIFVNRANIKCRKVERDLEDLTKLYGFKLTARGSWNRPMAIRYKIASIDHPTMILYRNGVEISRRSGHVSRVGLEHWLTDVKDDLDKVKTSDKCNCCPPSCDCGCQEGGPCNCHKTTQNNISYKGTWNTTNRPLDGGMSCVVSNLGDNKYRGHFYGVWRRQPFSYKVEFSGTPERVEGKALIDGASYQWVGVMNKNKLSGKFTGNRYLGSFDLRACKNC